MTNDHFELGIGRYADQTGDDDCTSVGSSPLIAAVPERTRDGLPFPVCSLDGTAKVGTPMRIEANVRLWRAVQYSAQVRRYLEMDPRMMPREGLRMAVANAEGHRQRGRDLMGTALKLDAGKCDTCPVMPPRAVCPIMDECRQKDDR